MLYVKREGNGIKINADGDRKQIYQEFAWLCVSLVENEKKEGGHPEIFRELLEAAYKGPEELKEENERYRKDLMQDLPGTEEEKNRMIDVILAMMW